jgi:hypothetical protein
MAESFIHKNLADKRKEIQAYIGSLERDLEKARRDLSAIIVTEHVFQAKGPNVTAYMELSFLFPRHELPRLARAAMEAKTGKLRAPQKMPPAQPVRRRIPPLQPGKLHLPYMPAKQEMS